MTEPRYFAVRWIDDPSILGIAHPEEPLFMSRHDIYDEFFFRKEDGPITDWSEQRYELRAVEEGTKLPEAGFGDYQPEVRGLRLCSERLREALSSNKAASDLLQWLPVLVRGQNDEERRYWVLHFLAVKDILCYDRSMYEGGVAVPIIYLDKIGDHEVFASPDGNPLPFVVSERVRDALVNAGCRGLEFRKVKTVQESPALLRRQ